MGLQVLLQLLLGGKALGAYDALVLRGFLLVAVPDVAGERPQRVVAAATTLFGAVVREPQVLVGCPVTVVPALFSELNPTEAADEGMLRCKVAAEVNVPVKRLLAGGVAGAFVPTRHMLQLVPLQLRWKVEARRAARNVALEGRFVRVHLRVSSQVLLLEEDLVALITAVLAPFVILGHMLAETINGCKLFATFTALVVSWGLLLALACCRSFVRNLGVTMQVL